LTEGLWVARQIGAVNYTSAAILANQLQLVGEGGGLSLLG